ncbi:hypothetical protein G9A89_002749 [Geosiphon pyriformis]|nr:hypothetical protein G9A89_002749 [Geosiphon pyriformis]
MQQKLLLLLNEQNNEHTPIYKYFYIGKTLYERKMELETTNLTPEAIQKQIHNEFKTAAGLINTCYKLRAAFRLYNLFNTCENVLQNPILQPMKVQYIGKLTELKFQQFSDQITSIILDHYLNITDSAWTLTKLSLEKEIMLPKTTTRRERIGSKIDKYLLENITAAILAPSITIGKTIKEILPIDKNLSYERQLELYGCLGEIIEDMKLMKKTTSKIQVEILDIV